MKYSELLKGTLRTLVLNILSKNDKMYGYEINKAISELTSEEINLTFGALYPILHKLEFEELVFSSQEMINGRARKYYELTGKGEKISIQKTDEFLSFLKIMKKLLNTQPQ